MLKIDIELTKAEMDIHDKTHAEGIRDLEIFSYVLQVDHMASSVVLLRCSISLLYYRHYIIDSTRLKS
jgi:hypothetical protein